MGHVLFVVAKIVFDLMINTKMAIGYATSVVTVKTEMGLT
jgi:hypothetical protein